MFLWTGAVREMGGEEWARYAFENGTPIVPIDHVCHPRQILARGTTTIKPLDERVSIDRWPIGVHFYAKLDGLDVVDEDGNQKWNTYEAARNAAMRQAALSTKQEHAAAE